MLFRTVACLPLLTGAWRDRGGGFARSVGTWFSVGLDEAAVYGPSLATPGSGPTRQINTNQLGRTLTDPDLDPPVTVLVAWNGNPMVSVPNTELIRQGLAREDLFTVVHEQFMTDTARYADVVLPATTQLEQTDVVAGMGAPVRRMERRRDRAAGRSGEQHRAVPAAVHGARVRRAGAAGERRVAAGGRFGAAGRARPRRAAARRVRPPPTPGGPPPLRRRRLRHRRRQGDAVRRVTPWVQPAARLRPGGRGSERRSRAVRTLPADADDHEVAAAVLELVVLAPSQARAGRGRASPVDPRRRREPGASRTAPRSSSGTTGDRCGCRRPSPPPFAPVWSACRSGGGCTSTTAAAWPTR